MRLFRRKRYPKSIETEGGGRMLSFCITHQNRFEFLKKTLKENLSNNAEFTNLVDFILVDFSFDNKIRKWICGAFLPEIQSGYLKFFQTDGLPKWSASLAKNTAHRLASGKILTNLDCDNFVGFGGAQFVMDQFSKAKDEIVFWQYSGVKYDGSFGRISVSSKAFEHIGGYDESLLEMGWQDNDLIRRLRSLGLKLVKDKNREFNKAIKHEKYSPQSMSYEEMNLLNEKKAKSNLSKGILVANNGQFGIQTGILRMTHDGEMEVYN
ncbi:MAG: hypothetical protein HRT61_02620 [Ekhidna sp.]|nr:hypothetical protein [Ekhidna sp.]